MRVEIDLPGPLLPIRVCDRDGRGVNLRQGNSKIRISNRDAFRLADALILVARGNATTDGKLPMPNNALTKIQRHQQSGAWHRLEKLANGGPQEQAEAEAVIAEAERLTAAAEALLYPGKAVTPAKARMQRYPITPKRT